MEIRNAQIKKVQLLIEDHDILTFWLQLDLGGAGCCIGGYALDQSFKKTSDNGYAIRIRRSSPAGLDCIRKIMEVVGVREWSELEGKYIRYEDHDWGSSICKIGNIIKDKWIDLKEFFENYDYEETLELFVSDKQRRQK